MEQWNIWVDTGGTFTDCIAITPDKEYRKVKVLSSSSLRGTIRSYLAPDILVIEHRWSAPSGFIEGFQFKQLGSGVAPRKVVRFDAENATIRLDEGIPESEQNLGTFEVISDEEAPILACRLITKTLPGEDMPPLNLRLATTKGTNALLERNGAPTLLLISKGFKDLLKIGNQKRPELFTLDVQKPEPLYNRVIEIDERLDADGNVLAAPELDKPEPALRQFLDNEQASVAVCLMNSYRNDDHEQQIKKKIEELGGKFISLSSELSSTIKIVPRGNTATVNAYLDPILHRYLASVDESIKSGTLHIMTSAGGLVKADTFNPKDSLLSGPAGGVVGAASTGRKEGFQNVISFDMGGTSTDVARYNDGFDYMFEHTVGNATLTAPALSIETVAAGGGSICRYDGQKLRVGPESAGADPGPACYGAGGPFTITDVNLLLGRILPHNFGIPVNRNAAERKFREILEEIESTSGEEAEPAEILNGFLKIANERMADAIRKISLRKGYDPADYALVTFGGAGAQHACSLARLLGMNHVLIPENAGLLSAYGLGQALVERFAEEQVLQPLAAFRARFKEALDKLESAAKENLRKELAETGEHSLRIRRRLVFMRLEGQDSTIEIDYRKGTDLEEAFREAYKKRYGHWIENREIEVESMRVVASTRRADEEQIRPESGMDDSDAPPPQMVRFGTKVHNTPVYYRGQIDSEMDIPGPAIILDPYSTIVVEPGWRAVMGKKGTLTLSSDKTHGRKPEPKHSGGQTAKNRQQESRAVALELFTHRFTTIAGEMGEMLRRTALSVNVKERLDFSCGLLNAEGELVVNAPHIPVHLGALGMCVRKLTETVNMSPGDVFVTNHPAYGGSHLPDITVITPVYTGKKQLIGFTASRAHHAEIGGTRPGSMPPDATSLAEEGVVISPTHLVRKGEEQWNHIRKLLEESPYPTRNAEENIADLRAAVAANHRGSDALVALTEKYGSDRILHYMSEIKRDAAARMRATLRDLPDGRHLSTEKLDDGTPLKLHITKDDDTIQFDFEGTGKQHPGNLNATPAIVNSVIMYVLRLLVDQPLPLNEGLLEPVKINLPDCLLNPGFSDDPRECPALVGGNTEVSQRLVDLILKPFEKAACSQGTMNNVLFGNEKFGYYETIGGGTGAGPAFGGSNAVHHHMTNTAGTDPEILEHRYPVRLNRYAIRRGSGGEGKHDGGNGIIRELTFLEPVSLSVLTQHRKEQPYGLQGGAPGKSGRQWVVRSDGTREELDSVDGRELEAGDRFVIHTPGGGGFGSR